MTPLLLWLVFAQAVTPELRQHVEAGLKAKAGGDLITAIREFERVAELAPQLAAAHANLGAVYFEKRDYERALAPLRKALELNPDLPGSSQMLGTALLALGSPAEAIAPLEQARIKDLLGIALLESGRVRDAVDQLEAALLERPNDPDLLYYLGQAHARLSKTLFDQLPAGSARASQLSGEAMAAAGNREEAEKRLRAAIAARPELRGIHLALGELAMATGDYARAEAEFRAECALTPRSALAAYRLGVALANAGKTADAISELERSYRLSPEMPETSLELGKALAAGNRIEPAIEAFQRVVGAAPNSTFAESAHLHLAQLYRRLGRPTDAARELETLKQLRARPRQ
jgi:protein O-GlcNAc transferase